MIEVALAACHESETMTRRCWYSYVRALDALDEAPLRRPAWGMQTGHGPSYPRGGDIIGVGRHRDAGEGHRRTGHTDRIITHMRMATKKLASLRLSCNMI